MGEQFPNTGDDFVASTSHAQLALLVIGALLFVLIGAWIVGLFGAAPANAPVWAGWLCIVFFGGCAVVGMMRMVQGGEVLRINREGIWYRHFSDQTMRWSDIAAIDAYKVNNQKFIAITLCDPKAFPASGMIGKLRGLNNAIGAGDVAISLNGTNRSFKQTYAEIERWTH